MSKSVVSSVGVPLFATPICYPVKPCHKTVFVNTSRDNDGTIITRHEILEDSSEISSLDFTDVTLSNLIKNGVEPHSLDMISVSKIGIDKQIDSYANIIIANVDKYVIRGESYNKSEK